jgi:hypothetical protein
VSLADPTGETSAVTWSVPALTPARAWRALSRTFAAEAAGRQSDYVKMMVDGALIFDRESWPTAGSDSDDLTAWLGRVADITSNGDLFVFARSVQQHDRVLFKALVEMMAPDAWRSGLAPGHVEAEVFYGAYRSTPGGIHREDCTNLHLVLSGRKSMHFWVGRDWIPSGSALRNDVEPEAGTPEEYLPELDFRSVMLSGHFVTAIGGQGFFWRSGVWHVGETHEPSIALNIASYTNTLDPDARLLKPWNKEMRGEIPRSWLSDYRVHSAFTGDDAALLARLTALGMRPARASRTALDDIAGVTLASTAPVIWCGDGDKLTVGALGQACTFPDGHVVREWLDATLLGAAARADVPPACRGIARWLWEQEILDETERS